MVLVESSTSSSEAPRRSAISLEKRTDSAGGVNAQSLVADPDARIIL